MRNLNLGRGGFTIHAADGRVALAGVDAEGTTAAVERYLGDHGIRLYGPGIEAVADMKADFLHELYTLDKPWFVECPGWDRWWLSQPAKEAALPRPTVFPGESWVRPFGHLCSGLRWSWCVAARFGRPSRVGPMPSAPPWAWPGGYGCGPACSG